MIWTPDKKYSDQLLKKELDRFEAGVIHKTLFNVTQPIIATAYPEYLDKWFYYIFRFYKFIRIKEID